MVISHDRGVSREESGILYIFFFKQKTAYEIRPCDWSSDVCSSDLAGEEEVVNAGPVNGGSIATETRSEERRVGKELRSCVDLGGRRIIKKKKKNDDVDGSILYRCLSYICSIILV